MDNAIYDPTVPVECPKCHVPTLLSQVSSTMVLGSCGCEFPINYTLTLKPEDDDVPRQ